MKTAKALFASITAGNRKYFCCSKKTKPPPKFGGVLLWRPFQLIPAVVELAVKFVIELLHILFHFDPLFELLAMLPVFIKPYFLLYSDLHSFSVVAPPVLVIAVSASSPVRESRRHGRSQKEHCRQQSGHSFPDSRRPKII